jgi:hypothetical protein
MRDRNPAWSRAFDIQDAGKARELLRVAQSAMDKRPELAERADMRALTLYMQGRDALRSYLTRQEYKSLDHPANEGVRVAWERWVRGLVADNIGFEQMYNRVLERDDIGQPLDASDVNEEIAGRA